MRRDARWTYLLNELGAQDDAVRNGLMEWILSKASSNIYKSVKTPGHIITEHGYIDWRSFFDVTGSVAINKTEGPFLPLLSYDHIFIGLNPCPLNAFNLFHAFTWDDIPKLSEYARNKRVLFYLTDKHDTYGKFGYMQGLFEEFRPLHLPHAHVRLVQMDAFPHPFDAITEAATEQPNIKQAIGSFAKTNFMPLTTVDATICYTLQELHYAGHEELANACLELLRKEPEYAIEFVWLLRRIWLDPIYAAPGVPHAFDSEDFSGVLVRSGSSFQRSGVSFPGDVGSIIADIASFPTPSSWDSLRWCEEHLDLPAIRRAFEILNAKAVDLAGVGEVGDALRDELRKAAETALNSASKTKHAVFWSTSMSVALLGTLFTGPVVGILAALGMTAATNVWLDPLSESISRTVQPSSFHLWKMQKSLGRRKRNG
jgi:hypothetical protein